MTNSSHDDQLELSLHELADIAGGTSLIKVVMDAYNAALTEARKDAIRSYVALGSASHPL